MIHPGDGVQYRLPPPALRWRRCGPLHARGKPAVPADLAWPQFAGRGVSMAFSGRYALYKAVLHFSWRAGDEILVPAYNCGTDIDAYLQAGLKLRCYRINHSLDIDIAEIAALIGPQTKAVHVTHFFGIARATAALAALCRDRGMVLIEDCAPSLFADGPDGPTGTAGDAAIYSFAKSVPVPDGGALVINKGALAGHLCSELPDPEVTSRLWRKLQPPRAQRIDALGLFGLSKRLRFGWRGIDAPVELPADERLAQPEFERERCRWGASELTLALLSTVDPAEVTAGRRRNFEHLGRQLSGLRNGKPLFSELPAGACPLYFPLIVQRRQRWVHALQRYGIDAIPFWRSHHPAIDWQQFPDEHFLKTHILVLPVHQQLGPSHMETIGAAVRRLDDLFDS